MRLNYEDVVYQVIYLASFLALVILVVLFGVFNIPIFVYLPILFASGGLFLLNQFIVLIRRSKLWVFSDVDLRKSDK